MITKTQQLALCNIIFSKIYTENICRSSKTNPKHEHFLSFGAFWMVEK